MIQIQTYRNWKNSEARKQAERCGVSIKECLDSGVWDQVKWIKSHILPTIKANPNQPRRAVLNCCKSYDWDLLQVVYAYTGLTYCKSSQIFQN